MAGTELEFLDSAVAGDNLAKIAAGRALNRRNFITTLGMAGASAGAALLGGCSSETSAVTSTGLGMTDILNFALNLEYLEATFYSYITKGADLPSNLLTNSGAVTGAPAQIAFSGTNASQITDMLNEIYYDELNHVRALITQVGSAVIARPAINLSALGSISASNALSIARLLEDVGTTAYAGIAAQLNGGALGVTSQILATEGFHSGALRLASIQTSAAYLQADSMDVKPADPGTAALAASGPTANGAFFATSGAANASASTPAGFAFARTTSQVLAVVYANSAGGTSSGGFFPSGVNGAIKAV